MKNRMMIAALALTLLVTLAVTQHVNAAKKTLYVAICTERAEHGGIEVAVGPQRATLQEAREDGKAHELYTRGHRWRIGTN